MWGQWQLRFLCALACALPVSALNPQLLISQYQKRNWQVEDGLPHNYVMSVHPGPGGYLLVGTDEGLARFDGLRFVPYDLDPALGFSRRWILTLVTARDGSLWTGTFDGGLYQWRDGKVLRRFEPGASVFAIAEDASGRIWASTRHGVLRIAGDRAEDVPQLSRPPDTAWNVLAADHQGNIWVVTTEGLFRCSGPNTVEHIIPGGGEFGQVLSVYSMADRNMAVGTSKGLYVIPEADRHAKPHKLANVPGPAVSLLQDRDRNLWIGTWGQGLFRLSGTRVEGFSAREGLPDVFVRTLFEDPEGNLWIGVRGGGLSRWKNPAVVPIGIPEGLAGEFASAVISDNKGTLWLGTWRGGLYRHAGGGLISEPTPVPTLFFTVRALAIDSQGKPWVGNWEGITRFNGPGFSHFGGAETPYQHVSTLLFDRQGRLWVGTSDNGLFLFASGAPEGSPTAHVLSGREVAALQEDGEGNIWVGTNRGAGFVAPNKTDVLMIPALKEESIAGLSLDTRRRVWACTMGGALWQLTPHTARGIDARAGLPHHPLYRALDDGAGSLWISSPKGILRLALQQVERALDSPSSPLDVERYTLADGMRTIECHRLSQPSGGARCQRGFVVPDNPGICSNPSSRRDKCASAGRRHRRERAATRARRTQPRDSVYRVAVRHSREGAISLPHGAVRPRLGGRRGYPYREVQRAAPGQVSIPGVGTNAGRDVERAADDVGHAVAQVLPDAVVLCPPPADLFHGCDVDRSLAGPSGVSERYAAVMAERNRIGREWHDTLVAGFSAISLQLDAALQRLGEPSSQTREILEVTRKMVHHYRAEARRVIWDLRDNRPETERLVDAIENAVRQATDGKDIRANVKVSGPALEASRDVEHNVLRICQEALNNAIRHGAPQAVDVSLDYTPGELRVRIADDGKGFSPEEATRVNLGHFGLTVMQERARRFGGTFRLSSEPGHGTVVEAAVPLGGRNLS